MRTKFYLFIAAAFLLSAATHAQQNATNGAGNFYKNLYGTQIGASRGEMDAVVFIDSAIDPDSVVDGLVSLGYSVTLASDWTNFDALLVSGNYGLAVGFVQNERFYYPSVSAIQTFINNGGCMIYCDWNSNPAVAGVFEASFSGTYNHTAMTITDPGLSAGLTNPMPLANPTPFGWGIFSTGLNAIGSGQVLATFENGSAAIVRGNGGKTIMLGYLSDTPQLAKRKALFMNVVKSTDCGMEKVPVADWALYLGILLMVSFVAIRYARTS